jgi:HD-GYP domain-containing protein (c-di-GMP phosphodiesterase class II)/DNA-binding CsgD family transcriptional regulator
MLREGGRAGTDDIGLTAAVAAGLEAMLQMRAPELAGTTAMVRQLAVQVSRELGLDERAQKLADLSAGVRDVGMIGLPDSVVLNTGPLSSEDWALLNRHPVLGAELLGAIPETSALAPVVRAHHERWDGEGYPDGLRREAIPVLSRVIAVCDAFVAIASDRPHRRGLGAEGALDYLSLERGSQFDPDVVESLLIAVTSRRENAPAPQTAKATAAPAAVANAPNGAGVRRSRTSDLQRAMVELEVIPVFGPAWERAIAATGAGGEADHAKLVAAIEPDLGLTVALLRRAQTAGSRRPVANISDAVGALGAAEIRATIRSLPRAAFPWQSEFEALLHHRRVHAQAVARATERLARALEPDRADDLLTAALLHDAGKLVLGRALPEYTTWADAKSTPEQRLRRERHAFSMDHAALGGILLERWGLPAGLCETVAGHHTARDDRSPASSVRLADMVAHLAQGDAVERNLLMQLAAAWSMSVRTLRDALFDLPHSSGSRRRRAEPSPLSSRETAILKLMAEGQRAAHIAHELHLSESTVRSHLHNTYGKLNVPDRAQAVLLASERAWI